MKSNHNYGISLVRALSVLYIVGYWHLFNYTTAFRDYYNPVTHNLTRIVLASFVFVSGYLIASKNLEFTWRNILNFWQKRLVRIYPLYALALLLFYLNDIARGWTLVKAALLISMFFPPSPPTLWFITMIMLFYLLAPILIRCVDNLSLYLGLNALVLFLFNFSGGSGDLSAYFPSFSLSIWLRNHPVSFKYLQRNKLFLTLLFLVLFYFKTNFENIPIILDIIFINLGSILFYFYSSQIMDKSKYKRAVETISYASFCMYLFHRPIFVLTRNLFFPMGEVAQVLYLAFVAVPLIIIISWLIQKLYDKVIDLAFKKPPVKTQPLE